MKVEDILLDNDKDSQAKAAVRLLVSSRMSGDCADSKRYWQIVANEVMFRNRDHELAPGLELAATGPVFAVVAGADSSKPLVEPVKIDTACRADCAAGQSIWHWM